MKNEDIIGKFFDVIMDRPVGTVHPKHPNIIYPINYGYVPGLMGGDGEEQDVYILGCEKPLESFRGKVIAIIHRLNDIEDKWVMSADNKSYTREDIAKLTHFQEQFYTSKIIV